MSVLDSVIKSYARKNIELPESEEELNRYVAELILKEAAEREKSFKRDGISTYFSTPPANLPRPNKRFLSAVVQNTFDHNKSLLEQTKASCELKLKKLRRSRNRSLSPRNRDYKKERKRKKSRRAEEDEDYDASPSLSHSNQNAEKHTPTPELERNTQSQIKFLDNDVTQFAAEDFGIKQETQETDNRNNKKTVHTPPQPRGRGQSGSSRLDKFFQEGYDPKFDIDNYDESNIHVYLQSLQDEIDLRLQERSDERERRRLKRKKNKRDRDSYQDSESSDKSEKESRKKTKKKKKKSRKNIKEEKKTKDVSRSSETHTNSICSGRSPSPVYGPSLTGIMPRGPEQCPW